MAKTSRLSTAQRARITAAALEVKARSNPEEADRMRATAAKLLKGAKLLESFQATPSETDGSRPSSPEPGGSAIEPPPGDPTGD
ncbi:MAG: hypothetical protein U1E60_04410 [Reyranellaceae bacterium]